MYPSYTDLLGFSLHHKGSKSNQTQAGNHNGQDGEDDGKFAEFAFIFIECIQFFIQEGVFEGPGGGKLFPDSWIYFKTEL